MPVQDAIGPFVDGRRLIAAGAPGGPLAGSTFVAKDLFDVAGTPTGAGNPTWAAAAAPAATHASVVAALLAAGADLVGKTHTDELAWSISGTNHHYGTPVNPVAPDRAPGGSSSGSVVAVASGAADLGLGTDTGGSIRVPASYCGVLGLRPTHGRVPLDGVVPLAPTFDTVGLFARDAATLRAGWGALPKEAVTGRSGITRLVVLDDLVGRAEPDVAPSLLGALAAFDLPVEHAELGAVDEWLAAFRVLQSAEVWSVHGAWFATREPVLGPGVAERFAYARSLTDDDVAAAQPVRRSAAARLAELLGDDAVLVAPAAPTAAHPLALDGPAKQDLRRRTLALTAPAGLAGLPCVSIPRAHDAAGLPVGVALIGAPGDDDLLLELATR